MAQNTKYSPQITAKILQRRSAGCSWQGSLDNAGVDFKAHMRWRQKHPEYDAACKAADADVEYACVENIMDAAKTSWQAAAWYLERHWPERWGKTEQANSQQAPVVNLTIVEETK